MLTELEKLNEAFFRLYGGIYENTELLTKRQSDYKNERLFEQYKQEYVKLALEKETEDARDLFVLKMRKNGYVPWKFLFWKNSAYKLLKAQLVKELDEYYDKKFEELADLKNGEDIDK